MEVQYIAPDLREEHSSEHVEGLVKDLVSFPDLCYRLDKIGPQDDFVVGIVAAVVLCVESQAGKWIG